MINRVPIHNLYRKKSAADMDSDILKKKASREKPFFFLQNHNQMTII